VTQPNILIWDYVKDLLHAHDCVIVPGFGGFVCNREPARIDQVSHVITPPSRKVVFNQNLKTNDGLLAEFWSQKQRVTYSQALATIESSIEAILNTLHEKKQLSIDLFGSFRLNAEANYVFIPDKRNNYLISSFGLAAIQAQPVASRTMKMIPKAKPRANRMITPSRKRRRSILTPILGGLLAVVLCVNGYIFLNDERFSDLGFGQNNHTLNISSWFDSLFHDTVSKQEIAATTTPAPLADTTPYIPAAPQEPVAAEPTTAAPVIQQPVETSKLDLYSSYYAFATHYGAARSTIYFPVQPEDETPVQSELVPAGEDVVHSSEFVAENAVAVEKGFFVIGGMFCKERNARRFLRSLTDKGYAEAQLLPSRRENCQRVSYKKFASKHEAENFCSQIRTETNPEAWVLEVF
jgi:nucleoid DNA-binding protein